MIRGVNGCKGGFIEVERLLIFFRLFLGESVENQIGKYVVRKKKVINENKRNFQHTMR